jgi:hypothetical protein
VSAALARILHYGSEVRCGKAIPGMDTAIIRRSDPTAPGHGAAANLRTKKTLPAVAQWPLVLWLLSFFYYVLCTKTNLLIRAGRQDNLTTNLRKQKYEYLLIVDPVKMK